MYGRCRKEKYTAGDNEVNIALVVPQCSCFPIKHLFRSAVDVRRNLMGILRCVVCFFFKMRKYCSVNFKSLCTNTAKNRGSMDCTPINNCLSI